MIYSFVLILFMSSLAHAEIDPFVFIEGKIGTAFTKTEILVIDEFNQKYYLPKSLFPKKFKFTAGQKFEVEIEKEKFEQLKVLK